MKFIITSAATELFLFLYNSTVFSNDDDDAFDDDDIDDDIDDIDNDDIDDGPTSGGGDGYVIDTHDIVNAVI